MTESYSYDLDADYMLRGMDEEGLLLVAPTYYGQQYRLLLWSRTKQ